MPLHIAFASTIFLSSFLLFLVQPVIAKQVLPWFGGSASVWTTCIFFFQLVLLLGYAYAHALVRFASPRAQAIVHVCILAAAAACLPIIASPAWKTGDSDPSLRMLGLLAATVGAPYFALSTTSPLVQAWYARALSAPWRLFALSNAASLAGLLVYPSLIETNIALRPQALFWSGLFALFAALCAFSAIAGARAPVVAAPRGETTSSDQDRPFLWLALSALGSLLLVSITAFIGQNVASAPLLWVAPLALYLVTFIIAFESARPMNLRIVGLCALVLCGAMLGVRRAEEIMGVTPLALALFMGGLFVACLYCHGALAATKPAPARLTYFYMMISLGGAIGSLAGGVLAPALLAGDFEMPLALAAVALLHAVMELGGAGRARLAAALVALAFCVVAAWQIVAEYRGARLLARNFYSSLQVVDVYAESPDGRRKLMHGRIEHGAQYLDPKRKNEPIAYYNPDGGVGLAIARQRERLGRPLSIGVVGLGAGAIAAYGEKGGKMRYYEINPQVIDIARREFSFLSDSAAEVTTVLGDARLVLEREAPQAFDLLAVDAFSGDAIPMHLITSEAMQVYRRHLASGGVIAFHVTNMFVDLKAPVAALAREAGMTARLVAFETEEDDDSEALASSDWIIIAPDADFFDSKRLRDEAEPITIPSGLPVWTDDFNNLLTVLKSPFSE